MGSLCCIERRTKRLGCHNEADENSEPTMGVHFVFPCKDLERVTVVGTLLGRLGRPLCHSDGIMAVRVLCRLAKAGINYVIALVQNQDIPTRLLSLHLIPSSLSISPLPPRSPVAATQRNALPPPYPGPLFPTRSVCPRGTMPIRSKRNFKELQLNVSPAEPPEPDPPVPTRMAPPATKPAGGSGKKRPPPMNLKPKVAADAPTGDAASDGLLAVAPGPTSAPASANTSTNMKRMTYHTTLSNTLANLDMNAEVKYDLRDEDLKDLNELGQGNGGSVKKVEHVPTHTIMAKKVLSFVSYRCG